MRKLKADQAIEVPSFGDEKARVLHRSEYGQKLRSDLRKLNEKAQRRLDLRKWLYDAEAAWIEVGRLQPADSKWYDWLKPAPMRLDDDRVYLCAVTSSVATSLREKYYTEIANAWRAAEARLKVKSSILSVEVCGTVETDDVRRGKQTIRGDLLYKDRSNRAESAVDFLMRSHGSALVDGTLTLSDLRKRDESLWRGLRNWAHAGKHNLDELIPRGRTERGRPRENLGFDPAELNPDDPRDALTLRSLRNREQTRERMRKRRAQPSNG